MACDGWATRCHIRLGKILQGLAHDFSVGSRFLKFVCGVSILGCPFVFKEFFCEFWLENSKISSVNWERRKKVREA